MFFIAYAFKGQVHVFAGRVKIVSHSSTIEIFLSPAYESSTVSLKEFVFRKLTKIFLRSLIFDFLFACACFFCLSKVT